MSALDLLCEIVASQGKVSAAFYRERLELQALIDGGYLEESGLVTSIVCDECDDFHPANIEFEENKFGYFCPEFGFIPVAKANLTAIKPNTKRLIEGLVATIDCTHCKLAPIDNATWRIGKIETYAGDLAIYFHPQLIDHSDLRSLESAISMDRIGASHRLIFTARGVLPVPSGIPVRLTDAFVLTGETNQLSLTANVMALAGIAPKRSGGRPNKYHAKLLNLIQKRQENGLACGSKGAEAKALKGAYEAEYPNETAPSVSTIKRYLSEFHGGSKLVQN